MTAPRVPKPRFELAQRVRSRSHGPPGLSCGRPDLRDAGLSPQRLGHGQAHARATGALRTSAAAGVRAGQGHVGSCWCHQCPVARSKEGRGSRGTDDRLAQPSPKTSCRSGEARIAGPFLSTSLNGEISDVSEHQTAAAPRSRSDRCRAPRRGSPVCSQDQRLPRALEGQSGRVRHGRARGSRGGAGPIPVAPGSWPGAGRRVTSA